MDFIVVEGVRPWDGRYEFDLETAPFTTREWGWIKRHAGYMPLTIDQGWQGADPELFAVFAVITLYRAGRITPGDVPDVYERFADAPFGGTIRLETDDQAAEDDAGPPDGNANVSSNGSGTDTSESSATSERHSGIPDSATSESRPVASRI